MPCLLHICPFSPVFSFSACWQNLPKVNKELAMKLMEEGEDSVSRKAKKKAKVRDVFVLAA